MTGEDGVTVQEVVGIARVVELVGVENILVQGGGHVVERGIEGKVVVEVVMEEEVVVEEVVEEE